MSDKLLGIDISSKRLFDIGTVCGMNTTSDRTLATCPLHEDSGRSKVGRSVTITRATQEYVEIAAELTIRPYNWDHP